MNDLFPVQAKPDSFYSRGLRIMRVEGDGMDPTLRCKHDFVFLRPVDRYVGEGVYLIGDNYDGGDLYRATSRQIDGKSMVHLYRDNKHYSEQMVTREQFEEHCLGIVVADIKVRQEHLLYEPAR